MKNIYQLALRCKRIYRRKDGYGQKFDSILESPFTDYNVKGDVDEYLAAIEDLRVALADKFPNIAYELRLHKKEV